MEEYIANLIIEIKNNLQSLPNLVMITNENLIDMIEQQLQDIKRNAPVHSKEYEYLSALTFKHDQEIVQSVYGGIRGLDLLEKFMNDKSITEIMINGYDNIFVERSGKVIKVNDTFESQQKLIDIIQKFVQKAGRSVDHSNPIVDTRLEDGSRVNVVMPPIALNGPIVTIRRFPEKIMTVEKLIEYGSITEEVAHFLEVLVKSRFNVFISGGTGSGKTTFLNALSNFIPNDQRVITVEDSAELQINKIDNLVRLETRNANSTGVGGISIRDLIKSSLRMRPDRIIVGEVRGAEALDMLQAMNTGHDGSLSTGHANSTSDMLSRLETMVLSGTNGLPLEAIRQQIASAIDVIIHLSRLRDHSRKTMEIVEVLGYKDGEIILNPIYQFVESEDTTVECVKGQLVRTENEFKNVKKLNDAGIWTKF